MEDPTKSDPTLIGDVPKETKQKKARPPRKATKNPKNLPETVYVSVDHPKQSPVQTDDEKMRKKQQRLPKEAEITVYSEISKSQESEDQNAKTIYEVVKNPLPARPLDCRALV